MSAHQLTRCPHCASVFRLRPDQLQQAAGWLRCGQCRQVFDASERVLHWPSDLQGTERLDLQSLLRSEDRSAMPMALATDEPHAGISDDVLAFERALASFPTPELPLSSTGAEALPQTSDVVVPVSSRQEAVRWRWPLFWVALLLVQMGWAWRAQWAVQWPALGLGAQALCERMGCRLLPWRESRVLAIEHAHLALTETGHRLQWVLHNRAAWPVLTPALELTLLDEREQVLSRRVLRVQELPLPSVLAPQQEVLAHVAWSWPNETPVAAYRLTAFYP